MQNFTQTPDRSFSVTKYNTWSGPFCEPIHEVFHEDVFSQILTGRHFSVPSSFVFPDTIKVK